MIDYKQTTDGDIDLSTGDISPVESTEQHKSNILMAYPGDYAQWPLVGVGLMEYLNDTRTDTTLLRDVSRQMQQDGIDVRRVSLENGELIIDGEYENNKG